jgi:Beta-galactosidase
VWRVAWLLVGALLLVSASAGPDPEPLVPTTFPTTETPTWGVAGPLPPPSAALKEAGVGATILELSWRDAEPGQGVWNEAYFAQLRDQIAALRSAGISVVLNTGLQEPPDWAFALPGARYVDQAGRVSDDSAGLNLVWNHALRPLAAAYLAAVFRELGTGFAYVRVGGGEQGELTYPRSSGVTGSYWAFDAAAAAADPVPGWRPGDPSPAAARTFLSWYFSALAAFQNWQIETVRSLYPGPIAVLYPDVGVTPSEIAAAVADGLDGTSPAEASRRIQAGQDHDASIAAIRDRGVVAWCTWANEVAALTSVAEPARRRGLDVVGENSGDETSQTDLAALAANQRAFDLRLVIWVRYDTLVSGKPGDATLVEFTRTTLG